MDNPSAPSRDATPSILCELVEKVGLVQWQNRYAVCTNLTVTGAAAQSYTDLQLRLRSEPAVFVERCWQLDALSSGTSVAIDPASLELDPYALRQLTEATRVRAVLTLCDAAGRVLQEVAVQSEALSVGQWGGCSVAPELLAAFVQPNDATVAQLLKHSARWLEGHAPETSLVGYKGGPLGVWKMAQAAWAALVDRRLSYALPPPAFEQEGQKVRTAQAVLDSGLATCLDSTVLLAALFEAMGLHAVVMLVEGHAFVAVWLYDERFDRTVTTDLAAVRNRIFSPRRLVVVETTLLCGGGNSPPSFAQAVERAEATVHNLQPTQFRAAIDVASARVDQVRPLTEVVDGRRPAGAQAQARAGVEASREAPNWLTALGNGQAGPSTGGPAAKKTSKEQRLAGWKKELLDLNKSNPLISLKLNKKTLHIVVPDVSALEDGLADKARFKLQPLPHLAPPGKHVLSPEELRELEGAAARRALADGVLYVRATPAELEAMLVELFRKARLMQQEGDANAMFLTIGSLRWRHEGEERSHVAPLILLPVVLERSSVSAPFYLSGKDVEDARLNPTLIELLRRDFRVTLPLVSDELPRDASGLDVDAILNAVGTAVHQQPGFEVVRESILSLFSFTRYLLWRDLEDDPTALERNAVVAHLLNSPAEPFEPGGGLPSPHSLDDELVAEEVATTFPADSSQLVAVQAALRGKNLVLIGPPGTGKSQTIANIIAQSLAAQKRVLFVSAKAEALDVVYRRLKDRGLAELCLSMHRHEGGKGEYIEQMRQAWAAPAPPQDEAWQTEADRFTRTRAQLNGYARALHAPASNGLTPYRAIGQLAAYKGPAVHLRWPANVAHDVARRQELMELAHQLGLAATEALDLAASPLQHVTRTSYSPVWQNDLLAAAEGLGDAAGRFDASLGALRAAAPEVPTEPSFVELAALLRLVQAILALPVALGGPAAEVEPDELARRAAEALQGLGRHRSAQAQAPVAWTEGTRVAFCTALHTVVSARSARAKLAALYPTLASSQADGTRALVTEGAAGALDAHGLREAWNAAAGRMWPLRWWARRRVRATLARHRREPAPKAQVLGELNDLAALQDLDRSVRAYAPPAAASELWRGTETDVAAASALLAFHGAIAGERATAEELRLVEGGQCGRSAALAFNAWREAEASALELRRFAEPGGPHALPSSLWRGADTVPEELAAAQQASQQLWRAAVALGTFGDDQRRALVRRLRSAADASGGQAWGRAGLAQFVALTPVFLAAAEHYLGLLQEPHAPGAEALPLAAQPLAEVAAHARSLPAWRNKLRPRLAWLRARSVAAAAGLLPLVEALEARKVAPELAGKSFAASYASWWLDQAVTQTPALNNFVAAFHERAAADFWAADDYLAAHASARIRHRLNRSLPSPETVPAKSSWGRLSHELSKKKRFVPMRKLFEVAREAIAQLMPCFMMSPLSVAQFLPLNNDLFDLVIFDEASQVRCSEAIGAMARGKQVIMVGDPKQMPPSNFFSRATFEDEEDELAEDDGGGDGDGAPVQPHESILDLCHAARLPELSLRWHYRSRHEELIAFSNAAYYGGELVTFCSPDNKARAVTFHHVEGGLWGASKGRHNQREARALVADIVSRIRDGSFAAAGHKVGVIAFNSTQSRLIEDLLDQEAKQDARVAEATGPEGALQLFVKNLESVQGDERDVIYISVGYAPSTPGGELAHRFGPLNNAGGERRLNVAVTRARCKMHVFCSFHSDQLRDAKLKQRGAQDLKRFLAYAEHGPQAPSVLTDTSVGGYDSPFEQQVADALRARGWEVESQVGVGAYRIDLGVLDPHRPGRFLAGVECDGATYHAAATARDRDKLRQGVLEDLGWNILRLWSTDFWHDDVAAIDRIDARLRLLVEGGRASVVGHADEAAAPSGPLAAQKAAAAEAKGGLPG